MTGNTVKRPIVHQISINDVSLRVYEWEGTGDPTLFLHATGFHSRCWDQVILQLPGAHVFAIDVHFHGGSSDDGVVDWSRFPPDISQLIEHLQLENITGVGHSMGGCVIARVAASMPDKFKQLVLIDPVIMGPNPHNEFTRSPKSLSPTEHPVAFRKNDWQSSEEMYNRFKSKPPFNTWADEVLRDYCEHALDEEHSDGRRQLACKPVNEAAFYLSSMGYEVMRDEIESIRTPTTILRAPPPIVGEELDFSASPTWPELASAMQCARDVFLEDLNHFIPMQNPLLVADYVQQARNADWR